MTSACDEPFLGVRRLLDFVFSVVFAARGTESWESERRVVVGAVGLVGLALSITELDGAPRRVMGTYPGSCVWLRPTRVRVVCSRGTVVMSEDMPGWRWRELAAGILGGTGGARELAGGGAFLARVGTP